jgi:hypothetical protein
MHRKHRILPSTTLLFQNETGLMNIPDRYQNGWYPG